MELLGIPFSLYGFWKQKRGEEEVTIVDKSMLICALIVVIVYFFTSGKEEHGIEEAVTSGSFLVAELLIAREKKLGWWLSTLANIFLVYILLLTRDYLFVLFQIASICIGLTKIFKRNK